MTGSNDDRLTVRFVIGAVLGTIALVALYWSYIAHEHGRKASAPEAGVTARGSPSRANSRPHQPPIPARNPVRLVAGQWRFDPHHGGLGFPDSVLTAGGHVIVTYDGLDGRADHAIGARLCTRSRKRKGAVALPVRLSTYRARQLHHQ